MAETRLPPGVGSTPVSVTAATTGKYVDISKVPETMATMSEAAEHRRTEQLEAFEPYKTAGGYDLALALYKGIPEETVAEVFGIDAVKAASGTAKTLEQLRPYDVGEGFDISAALEANADSALLEQFFTPEAIADAGEVVEIKRDLEPYVTEDGYDLVAAVNAGITDEDLGKLFSADTLDMVHKSIELMEVLEPYKTGEGDNVSYDVEAALSAGITKDDLLLMFPLDSIATAQSIIDAKADLTEFYTDTGYDVIAAVGAGIPDETLSILFTPETVTSAHEAITARGELSQYKKDDGGYDIMGAIKDNVSDELLTQAFGGDVVTQAHNYLEAVDIVEPYKRDDGTVDLMNAVSNVPEETLLLLFSPTDISDARAALAEKQEFEDSHTLVGTFLAKDDQVWVSNDDLTGMTQKQKRDIVQHGLGVLDFQNAKEMFDKYQEWGIIESGAEYYGEQDGQPLYFTADQVREMDAAAREKYLAAMVDYEMGRRGMPVSYESYKALERNPALAVAMEAYYEAKKRGDELGVIVPTLSAFKSMADYPDLLQKYIEGSAAIKAEYHAPDLEGAGVIAQFWSGLHHNIETLNLPRPAEYLWKGAIDIVGMPLQLAEVVGSAAYDVSALPKAEGFTAQPGEAWDTLYGTGKGMVEWFGGMPKRVWNDPLGEGVYTATVLALPVKGGAGKFKSTYRATGLGPAVLSLVPGATSGVNIFRTLATKEGMLPRAVRQGNASIYTIKVPEGFSQLAHELDAVTADRVLMKEIFESGLSKSEQIARIRDVLNPETRTVFDSAMNLVDNMHKVEVPKSMYRDVNFGDVILMPESASGAVKNWFQNNSGEVHIAGSFADWVQTKGVDGMWNPLDLDISLKPGAKLSVNEVAKQLADVIRENSAETIRASGGKVEILRNGKWHDLVQAHKSGSLFERPYEWEGLLQPEIKIEGISFDPLGNQMIKRGEAVLAPRVGAERGLMGVESKTMSPELIFQERQIRRFKDVERFSKQAEILIDVLREQGKVELATKLEADLRVLRESPRGAPTPETPVRPEAYESEFLSLVDEIQQAAIERGTDITMELPNGQLTRFISPAGKTIVGTVFHAVEDVRPYVRGAKRGFVEAGWKIDEFGNVVKADRPVVFLSPDAAMSFMLQEGKITPHSGIIAVRTVMGDIGKGKPIEPAFRVVDWPQKPGSKKMVRVIEDELTLTENSKILPTEPTGLSMRPNAISEGLVGETVTYFPGMGTQGVPILWFATESAKSAGLRAPNVAQIRAMNLLAVKAAIGDLLHPHLATGIKTGAETGVSRGLVEFWRDTWKWREGTKVDAAKVVSEKVQQLNEIATENLRKSGERFETPEKYKEAFTKELEKVYEAETAKLVDGPAAQRIAEIGIEEFRDAHLVNLSSLSSKMAAVGLGGVEVQSLEDILDADLPTYEDVRPTYTIDLLDQDAPVGKPRAVSIKVAQEVDKIITDTEPVVIRDVPATFVTVSKSTKVLDEALGDFSIDMETDIVAPSMTMSSITMPDLDVTDPLEPTESIEVTGFEDVITEPTEFEETPPTTYEEVLEEPVERLSYEEEPPPTKKIIIPRDDEVKRMSEEEHVYPSGAVAWRQGLAWIIVTPPYTKLDMEWVDAPPEGVYRIDEGSPDETVVGPSVEFTVPVGLFDVTYSHGTLTYHKKSAEEFTDEEELEANLDSGDISDLVDNLTDTEVKLLLKRFGGNMPRKRSKSKMKSPNKGINVVR